MNRTLTLILAMVLFSSCFRAHAFELADFFDAGEEAIVRSDLELLNSIRLSEVSALQKRVFGDSGFSDFFKTRILRVRRSLSDTEAYAFVTPIAATRYHDTLAVTSRYFALPQLTRIAVLVHEARHSEVEQNYWHHVDCPSPYLDANRAEVRNNSGIPLSGKHLGCDAGALGAYGVNVIMLRNIANYCQNCTPEMRREAAVLAADLVKRVVDQHSRDVLLRD